MLTRFLAILIFLAGYIGISSSKAASEVPVTGKAVRELASIDNLMVKFMREHQVPGGSVSITRNGRLIYSRGFGFSDKEKQIPVEPNSLFRTASLSKFIIAVGILNLADEGKLKLTDTIYDTLDFTPYVKDGEKLDERLRQVTIQDLLHHRGGWRANSEFSYGNIMKALGIKYVYPKDVVRYMMGRRLDSNPGAEMSYLNAGYEVLGRIIEEVSGQTYEQYIKQNVLVPVGITDMELARTKEKDLAAKEVRYYDSKYNPYSYNRFEDRYMWIATSADLAKLAADFDNPLKSHILTAGSIERMFAAHPAEKKSQGKKYYGCGWEVLVRKDDKLRTWHTGGMPGTSGIIVRRGDGVNWAVLFNCKENPDGKKLPGLLIGLFDKRLDKVKI
ncbi:MAG: beta-lactamase family protein [Sedimentisphaerales bacterium]|nr:beta-lactamase family protein [Sedimentisphaerales bacterium]